MPDLEEVKERILRELQELKDKFPEEWVAVEFDCTAFEEEERPVFLWRGGRRRSIPLRENGASRVVVLLTPEGLFASRLSLTFAESGGQPSLCPNWKEKEEADNLTWAMCSSQVEIMVAELRLQNISN